MGEIDKIKERISHLRFWLGICIALVISDCSWLINNYGKYDMFFILGIIFLLILFWSVLKLNNKINDYINKLEEL